MKAIGIGLLLCCLIGCASQDAPVSTGAPKSSPVDHSKPLTEEEVGLKFYPGARVVTSGQTDDAVSANLETSDPVDRAAAFYEQELGAKADIKPGLTTVEGAKGSSKYAVAITASDGKTSISIMGAKR